MNSLGFGGTKKTGYRVTCEAMATLVGTSDTAGISSVSINIMGEFNIAGEAWIIRDYFERMDVEVVATMTGDGRVDDIRRCHGAALNVVQCSGSMMDLAKMMEADYGIPFIRVSYFGLEDMAAALYDVAKRFVAIDPEIFQRAEALVTEETAAALGQLNKYAPALAGKKAAIYTGGAFKAFSLVRSLRTLGVKTVIAGSQTGNPADYELLQDLCDDGTILIDDTNAIFRHESGVHVRGMLADTTTYEPYPPELTDSDRSIVIGKHSGAAALRYALGCEGVNVSRSQATRLLPKVRQASIDSRGTVTAAKLVELFHANPEPKGMAPWLVQS